jgi:hypothetical protein
MKKILMVLLTMLWATASHATLTYDGSAMTNNASSMTFNNTGTSNTLIVVGIYTHSATARGSISYVKYGGYLMSQAVGVQGTTSSMYLFYLSSPPTGNRTLAITFRSAPQYYHVVISAYDGVGGVGAVAGSAPALNTALNYGGISSGSWGVYFAGTTGTAQGVTCTALTVRQSSSALTNVGYSFGDLTVTAAQLITVTASADYWMTGTMMELLIPSTVTVTNTPSPTKTATQTITQTATQTATQTSTQTITQTATPTATQTITQTATPTATQSATQTATPTNTSVCSPTSTPLIPKSLTQHSETFYLAATSSANSGYTDLPLSKWCNIFVGGSILSNNSGVTSYIWSASSNVTDTVSAHPVGAWASALSNGKLRVGLYGVTSTAAENLTGTANYLTEQ